MSRSVALFDSALTRRIDNHKQKLCRLFVITLMSVQFTVVIFFARASNCLCTYAVIFKVIKTQKCLHENCQTQENDRQNSRLVEVEQSLTPHPTQYRSFRRRSSQPITWPILTVKTVISSRKATNRHMWWLLAFCSAWTWSIVLHRVWTFVYIQR